MLGIIINPKSGKKAFRAQRIYLWKLLRKRHQPFAYRVTKYAGHAIELARELVEKGYDEILRDMRLSWRVSWWRKGMTRFLCSAETVR